MSAKYIVSGHCLLKGPLEIGDHGELTRRATAQSGSLGASLGNSGELEAFKYSSTP